jgi:hypothetical protein
LIFVVMFSELGKFPLCLGIIPSVTDLFF